MRIDPATLEETHSTDVGEGEAPLSTTLLHHPIGATLDSAWVGSQDVLIQLDAVDASVIERIQLDQAVDELSATPRDVWMINRLSRTLGRFSTEELQIVETVDLQSVPDAFAVGDEGVAWVVNREAGTVTPVRDGRPREPIRVGTRPVDIAVGQDAVWVADQADGTVTRIDPSIGRIEEVIDIGGPVSAIAVDPSTGAVWAYVL
jgi:hypothetical protein